MTLILSLKSHWNHQRPVAMLDPPLVPVAMVTHNSLSLMLPHNMPLLQEMCVSSQSTVGKGVHRTGAGDHGYW